LYPRGQTESQLALTRQLSLAVEFFTLSYPATILGWCKDHFGLLEHTVPIVTYSLFLA
jgi:hypothetical protein